MRVVVVVVINYTTYLGSFQFLEGWHHNKREEFATVTNDVRGLQGLQNKKKMIN